MASRRETQTEEPPITEPAGALHQLAELLRGETSVIGPYVVAPNERPVLGVLAASGARTAAAPGGYALVVEAVREGYLLHYRAELGARVVVGVDGDLALLAGDYLYALGLERLAALGDLAAVRELSDLISLAAQVHDGGRSPERSDRESAALWLACATAICAGGSDRYEQAKADLREDRGDAADSLWAAAASSAGSSAFRQALGDAAAGLDFRFDQLSSLG